MSIYDERTGTLSIKDDATAVEFEIATHQALVNNKTEFKFHGYTVEIAFAVDAVQAIKAQRIYH